MFKKHIRIIFPPELFTLPNVLDSQKAYGTIGAFYNNFKMIEV